MPPAIVAGRRARLLEHSCAENDVSTQNVRSVIRPSAGRAAAARGRPAVSRCPSPRWSRRVGGCVVLPAGLAGTQPGAPRWPDPPERSLPVRSGAPRPSHRPEQILPIRAAFTAAACAPWWSGRELRRARWS